MFNTWLTPFGLPHHRTGASHPFPQPKATGPRIQGALSPGGQLCDGHIGRLNRCMSQEECPLVFFFTGRTQVVTISKRHECIKTINGLRGLIDVIAERCLLGSSSLKPRSMCPHVMLLSRHVWSIVFDLSTSPTTRLFCIPLRRS